MVLRQWVTDQRAEYRQGALKPERAAELEAVPGWTWDPLEDAYQEHFTFRLSILQVRSGLVTR